MKKILVCIISFSIISVLTAQDIQVKGLFLKDSIKTGFPVEYSLTVTHPASSQIIFPDSLYSYAPFELIKKEHFPTRTVNNKSTDSAIYHLRTFELDRTQEIALPVFLLRDGDTTAIFPYPSTIGVKAYLNELPPTIVFKEQTEFIPVKKQFNYPYLLGIGIAIVLFIFILFVFFGRTIKRRYRLFIMRTDHNKFLKDFQRMQEKFTIERDLNAIEQGLSIWKDYLARLEHKPINTFTTTEIINLFEQEELKTGLNIIDRAIYGGLVSGEADKAIVSLRKFSVRQYHKRKREVQNA